MPRSVPVEVAAVFREADGLERLSWVCVGCGEAHMIPVRPEGHPRCWAWNGSTERPTLSPSILTRFPRDGVEVRCHSFVRDGVVEFLADCTHALAGQRVPMTPEGAELFAPVDAP